jgi:hypothetical protein
VRWNKKSPVKSGKSQAARSQKRGVVGYGRKTALLEEAITQMNAGKYGRSSAALKELLALDPNNMEARRLFATLHLRLGSLIPAKQAFDSLIDEAFQRQDYWLAESLLREYLSTAQRCVPFLEKLGLIFQEKGDALEAAAEYGKAVDILLEDPDPENPQRASQLYAKIRDLAPTSPMAFRLASFFDAQTGDLLTRPSTEEPEPISAPTLDPIAATSGGQPHCESINEPMPWELPDPLELANLSGPPALMSPLAASGEVSWQETHAPHEHTVFTDKHESQQTEGKTSDVEGEISSEIHTQEVVTTPSEAAINGPPEQTASGSVPELGDVVLPDSVGEVPATQAETDLIALGDDGAAPQDQGDGSGEDRKEALVDAPARSGPSALPDTTTIAELPKSIEAASQEATAATHTDLSDSSKPGSALGETAEPWLQSGFSWESVFNKAWTFGNQDAGNAASPEQESPRIEEPGAEALAGVSQEPPPEDQSEDSNEKDQQFALGDTTSTGMPIARMAWDQVQESLISIPPAQSDTAIEDATGLTVDQSDDVPGSDWVSTAEASGDETGLPETTSHEPESFSLVRDSETPQPPDSSDLPDNDRTAAVGAFQNSMPTELETVSHEADPFSIIRDSEAAQPHDPPVSRQVDRAVFDVWRASLSIEEEPQSSLPASSMIDELSMSEAPVSGVAKPPSREEPSAEDRTLAQAESHIESPDSSSLLSARTEQKLFEPAPEVILTLPAEMETVGSSAQNNLVATEAVVESSVPMHDPSAHQEEWQKAGDSIHFVEQSNITPVPLVSSIVAEAQEPSRPLSVAASAVEVLFESSTDSRKAETKHRAEETSSDRAVGSILSPIRIALTGALRTGFSTTRAIVAAFIGLVVLSVMVVALTIGAIGLSWVIMEEPTSPAFQSLTTIPQRTLSDSKQNGYLLLFGLDAAAGQDPAQGGDERNSGSDGGKAALTCFGTSGSGAWERSNASADVMRKWFRGSGPVGQFKSHQESIKGWSHEHRLMLDRYGQWKKLPFEDWGYGQPVSPPCATVAFAHQLHVADGFVQSMDQGVERLETDMEAWRIVLSQARTLPVKMLALQAINDDIAVASGLLVRSDFDGTHLGRVTKLLRPLDQGELSIRWPMQSELVMASKTYGDQLKTAQADARAVSTTVASMLPLPKQRRLNEYAEYYEASYKAAGEGHYGSLPKWKSSIRFPATTFTDYLTNPIENIVGLEPLPPWDLFNGLVVDTDAHLRLASLQAWLRRGPADGELLMRLAKAGQDYYDPYTGLPMLVNMNKGVVYSVGHDGKDQDGDPEWDVVVEIPVGHATTAPTKSAAGSSKTKV